MRTGIASGSNSNLYYSIDIGLVHFVVLDYTSYIGLPGSPKAPMLAWLNDDLQNAAVAAQRLLVPWIIVCAHVPMYASDGNNDDLISDVEPLLFEYGVDMHLVGHNHYVIILRGSAQRGRFPYSRRFYSRRSDLSTRASGRRARTAPWPRRASTRRRRPCTS